MTAIAACLLLPAAVVAGGCTRPGTGASAGSTAPAAETPTVTAPVTTPSPPVSLSAAIREWETVAREHFKASARALEQVSAGAGNGDESTVRSACTVLHDTNTRGLQEHLPTPDPRLTAELQRMIDDMNSATHACLRFIAQRNPADAEVYQEYLGRAVGHLQRAKAILDDALGPR